MARVLEKGVLPWERSRRGIILARCLGRPGVYNLVRGLGGGTTLAGGSGRGYYLSESSRKGGITLGKGLGGVLS